MNQRAPVNIEAAQLARVASGLLQAAGIPDASATTVADALVEADLQGQASHGVMLLPMYLERIRLGSVSCRVEARVVSERGAVVVLDAGHALGQLTADQAMTIAIGRAHEYGMGAVTVRHAFHFGVAARYALAAARSGCVGIALCNTRPLMPAPGGAERIVGNNPLSTAFPTDDGVPLVLDMATSEAAMGRIRMAEAERKSIPPGWATDSEGRPTNDPAAAIRGMLLPAGGAKGFGLAFMIDLLCGALSGGAWGEAVRPLFGDPAVPYDCSHFFLAMDVAFFGDRDEVAAACARAAARIRASRPAPGVERVYAPGEPEWRRRQDVRAAGDVVRVPPAVADAIEAAARALGVTLDLATSARQTESGGLVHGKT